MSRISDFVNCLSPFSVRRSATADKRSRFRPSVEALEDRSVPAYFWWTGEYSSNFDDPQNWNNGSGSTVPGAGDAMSFTDPALFAPSNVHDQGGPFNAISVDCSYTITLTSAISTNTFNMNSGATSQDADGEDITVRQSFGWTGGDINTSAFTGNLNLSPAIPFVWSATIAPANAGTVNTGNTLILQNGAIATFHDGTVVFTEGDGIAVGSGCEANFEIGTADINLEYTGPVPSKGKITLPTETKGTFYRKAGVFGTVRENTDLAIVITGGEFTLKDWIDLKVTGRVGANEGANVSQQAGITRLYSLSVLIVPNWIGVSGGTLTTVNSGTGNDQTAFIRGDLLVSGGEVTIDEGKQMGHHFGTLRVEGNITWIDGVFRPWVDGTVGSTLCDKWTCTGTFTYFAAGAVWGGNGFASNAGAKLGPQGALNNQANLAGRTWDILSAGFGFQKQQGSPDLSFETQAEAAVWEMLPPPQNGGPWTLRRSAN